MAKEIFKDIQAFLNLSQKQYENLAEISEVKSFKKGTYIFRPGDAANHLYMVRSGEVGLLAMEAQDRAGIDFGKCKPGDLFGSACMCAACMEKAPVHTLAAICIEDTEVIIFDIVKLLSLCAADTEFGYQLMSIINQINFERYGLAKQALREVIKASNIVTGYSVA